MSEQTLKPFVKWAGGKRQLLGEILERIPRTYDNYIEPFLGGGAVLFALQPKRALINDINASLIHTYKTIANNPQQFITKIKELDSRIAEGGKEYYYFIRELYNNKLMREELDLELAALFVFLNKHCFNGLYRVNSKGLFNVPYNNSKKASIVRLSKLFDDLTKKGCYCMLTNHNTEFINDLYENKGYKMEVVSVKRMINSDASKRTGEEIIICNY